jgi:porphyrinogen peroxidase
MPFGRVAEKEFGTYFIGYARSPRTIEQMLENMFVGQPAGNYDRLLDFSVAKTGNLFFVPSATFLENVGDEDPATGFSDQPAVPAPEPAPKREGPLDIGSLKGDRSHE